MEWSDSGIVLATRRHGENAVIADVLTQGHGRHLGLVRGGAGKRLSGQLQPGNSLALTWRARLQDHLGVYTVEMTTARAAHLIADRAQLSALTTLVTETRLLAEREPASGIHEALVLVLDAITAGEQWPPLLVRFELGLLGALGFGLDLSACAATGSADDLAYVSPRSRRAVCRTAGTPYHNRLLPLPGFLSRTGSEPTRGDVLDGLALTGFFLARDVFDPRGIVMPEARERLVRVLRENG